MKFMNFNTESNDILKRKLLVYSVVGIVSAVLCYYFIPRGNGNPLAFWLVIPALIFGFVAFGFIAMAIGSVVGILINLVKSKNKQR